MRVVLAVFSHPENSTASCRWGLFFPTVGKRFFDAVPSFECFVYFLLGFIFPIGVKKFWGFFAPVFFFPPLVGLLMNDQYLVQLYPQASFVRWLVQTG